MSYRKHARLGLAAILTLGYAAPIAAHAAADALKQNFVAPPASAKPWVYWFFMDGNESRQGMRADLEAMRKAGIGGVIRMDVNIGVPKGPVAFMSPEWRGDFAYGVQEAKRLGLQFSLETGPGWCGDGGPWITPEQSMQHLVASETTVAGPRRFDEVLPRPKPRPPFFGEGTMTPESHRQWENYYKDEYVVAFPTPAGDARIDDIDDKAFYYRGSASSGQAPWQFDPPANGAPAPADQCIPAGKVIELTGKLGADGRLTWDVPAGQWTIMRFGRTTTGQMTRPAPDAGLGFESDKFDRAGVATQFQDFVGNLLDAVGPKFYGGTSGLTMLHFDSWEVSSQNWSARFRDEFVKRRGYDPAPYLPVMTGRIVGSRERSERFLWDLRQTASDLIVDVHARYLADYAHAHGLTLSIEPYDLNPSADMDLGAMADLPMGEFWANGYGGGTVYSVVEATSIGHTNGRKIIGAESFTGGPGEDWRVSPDSMKEQLDWALCAGINKFVIHRYQHQPAMDKYPGMAMGPYGLNWERTETWWDMVPAFHQYIARSSQMLRQGLPVADILYLAPEGAPQVFAAPDSATTAPISDLLADRKGYNFDGCSPRNLIAHAKTVHGRVTFPDGMSYRVLVLPEWSTMTPALLRKITQLVEDGATVIGAPPHKSPSLTNYPAADAEVQSLAAHLWGKAPYAAARKVGQGIVMLDAAQTATASSIGKAQWIWFNEGDPARDAPEGTRYFRTHLEIPAGVQIKAAIATMAADNAFTLFINGHNAGGGKSWSAPSTLEITRWLNPGANEVLIQAVNAPGAPGANPAGLVGSIDIDDAAGHRQTVLTGDGWMASQTQNGVYSAARVLGPHNMGPWGGALQRTTVYQDYAVTADHLSRLGVAPDFASGLPIRDIHRRLSSGDLYFISNKSAQPIATTCVFRTAGQQPEWWSPLTGESRDLKNYAIAHGRTSIPVRLGPFESGFVLFRKPAASPIPGGANFAPYRTLKTLTSPWRVSFDPRWGGPAQITFDHLDDWSKRPEPGIRNYSGKAVYTTTFDAPSSAHASVSLSLGGVKNLASVRLNGHNLGALWCAPWRVSIPAGILKPRDNQLEITVANLWINRLIGDAGKPQEQRLTWTTVDNYRPDSPLQPSGLLGPVTIQAQGN